MTMKMAEAVALGKISEIATVDEALGTAATYGRFETGDLASILAATGSRTNTHRAHEATSLAQRFAGWAATGTIITSVFEVAATDDLDETA